jgi:hypothetical protein
VLARPGRLPAGLLLRLRVVGPLRAPEAHAGQPGHRALLLHRPHRGEAGSSRSRVDLRARAPRIGQRDPGQRGGGSRDRAQLRHLRHRLVGHVERGHPL